MGDSLPKQRKPQHGLWLHQQCSSLQALSWLRVPQYKTMYQGLVLLQWSQTLSQGQPSIFHLRLSPGLFSIFLQSFQECGMLNPCWPMDLHFTASGTEAIAMPGQSKFLIVAKVVG